ncbi:S-adenosyl-L-methionine-dependent methyltransferase [Myriangium duriaei CBS 260.36]|uniref:S-adenosyl-L-methionine-dependent methyltransferase n=1 Tax=Myriangium duriaei CBS 260.36 TaxID=1168546 RepID=A0A9P4MHK3_9PEZI|nr:S-adenosyl-L-methionine-dependent methyltransferase [Myriangium duriaei CBS 260.36]
MAQAATMEKYYSRLETRIGLKVLFGRASHHGFYEKGKKLPFPLSNGLRAMEEVLMGKLDVQSGERVLDAGCGAGVVAVNMAQQGINVHGVDILHRQVEIAHRNARAAGVQDKVHFSQGDYQSLKAKNDTFDAVFAIESLVHTPNASECMHEFYRVLKPGKKVVIFDVEHGGLKEMDHEVAQSILQIRHATAGKWPEFGDYQAWLEQAGFVDVEIEDLSENVVPLARFLRTLSAVPYAFIKPLGLVDHFPNTFAGHKMYSHRARKAWKYLAITARKPMVEVKVEMYGADPFADQKYFID